MKENKRKEKRVTLLGITIQTSSKDVVSLLYLGKFSTCHFYFFSLSSIFSFFFFYFCSLKERKKI